MGSYTTSELERDTGFGRRTIAYYVQEGLLPRVGRRGPRTRYPELVRDRLLFIRRVREAEAESEIRPVPLRDLRELFKALPPELVASVAAGDTPMSADIVSLASAEQRSMVDRVAALRNRLLATQPAQMPAPPFRGISQGERMPPRAKGSRRLDDDWTGGLRNTQELEPEGDMDELAVATPREIEDPGAMYVAAPRLPAFPFEDEDVGAAASPYRSQDEPDEDADTFANQLSWVLNELRSHARRRRQLAPDNIDTWSQVEVTSDIRLSIRGMADEDAFLLRVAGRLMRQVLESDSPRVERSPGEPGE